MKLPVEISPALLPVLPIQLDWRTRNEIRHALDQRITRCVNEAAAGRAVAYYKNQADAARKALIAFEDAVNAAMKEREHATHDKNPAS